MAHKVIYQSTGCLPGSSAVKSVPTNDLVRLTYRTAYSTGVPATEASPQGINATFLPL
ncbi:unnamed protein product [Durusdinium trenchii]|uniref:Uncharacterized protein n=1 Tax=Durusdinium trenchii TaxID=1381693 RepID=A0ABP0PJM6_9DINO